MPAHLKIKDVLHKTTQFFREKGFDTARLDTEILLSTALNWDRVKLYINYEYPLSETELATCREYVRRRATGEPIAYIIGRRDFYKHSFMVSPAVLIPRPETELLVEEALNWLGKQESGDRVVDLGTGSGCIGLSVIAERPKCRMIGVDLSLDALDIAHANADALDVAGRVTFLEADARELDVTKVREILGGAADAVFANPPYISLDDANIDVNVKKFEPAMALFAREDGLEQIRSWCAKTAALLRPGGLALFEIGSTQGRPAQEIFRASGAFEDIKVIKDLANLDRIVRAIRSAD